MHSRWTTLKHRQDSFDQPMDIVVVEKGIMGIKRLSIGDVFLSVRNVSVSQVPLLFLRIPPSKEVKEYLLLAV